MLVLLNLAVHVYAHNVLLSTEGFWEITFSTVCCIHTHTHSLDTSQIWRHSLLSTSQQSELLTYSIATLMKCVCCICVHALDCAIIIIIYVWSTMTTVQYSLTDVDRVVHVLVTLETISLRDDYSYSIPMAMYLNCLYSSTPLCPGWAG